ncbi:hypothetical protein CAEBREN_24219 [Caenorhabditis brenneri]|uniref:Uncharacterized protein n=1 Tax=Caenorhabditis brenneri TaxID=135651 RepID=G0MWQ7_CAEBE|nr:hypothetical protein CAEBREN_24219 [Caenorhabditis brenneri]
MATYGVQSWLVPVMEKEGPRVRTIEMEHTISTRKYKIDEQGWPHSTKTQEGARPILDILKIGNNKISIEIEKIGHNLRYEAKIRCKGDHSMSSFNLGSARFQMIEQRTEKGTEYTLIANSVELEIAQIERTGVRISALQP